MGCPNARDGLVDSRFAELLFDYCSGFIEIGSSTELPYLRSGNLK